MTRLIGHNLDTVRRVVLFEIQLIVETLISSHRQLSRNWPRKTDGDSVG
jgi:hypothetical protein